MNPQSNTNEERKGAGRGDRNDSEEVSLEREKSRGMSNYQVVDGEFTSFPEIMATSAQ